MLITRRLALPLLMSVAHPPLSFASETAWPRHAVKLLTPSQPGGSPDVIARVFGEALAGLWGQSVITENRPGADGSLAVNGLREAASLETGHALLVAPTTVLTVIPVLRERVPYDPVADAHPVSTAAADFLAIAVPSTLPVHSLDELMRSVQANPGQMNWFAAPGGPFMVFTDWMRRRKIDMAFVSYRGAPDALRDLAESRIQVIMAPLAPLLPLVAGGKVRLIAVSNPDRAPRAPDIPTVQEAGHSELTLEGTIAFFAPRNVSIEQRRKIASDIASVGAKPEIANRLAGAGQVVKTSSPEALNAYMQEQAERWRRLARDLGIRPT